MFQLQYCSFDAYSTANYISMILWYPTMGSMVLLWLTSWDGFLLREQKRQLELPGIEASAVKKFEDQLGDVALVWFVIGSLSLSVISVACFIHAFSCYIKG